MSVEYYYVNDLNRLYNAAVGDKTDGDEHHVRMIEAHDNLKAYVQKLEHWKDTALQLSRNNGEAQAKIKALEADYVISNRELLIKQVEIDRLTAELAELRERFEVTDDLLNQAVDEYGKLSEMWQIEHAEKLTLIEKLKFEEERVRYLRATIMNEIEDEPTVDTESMMFHDQNGG